MKLRLLEYGESGNIGDVIQTLAVAQHIKNPSDYIEREHLNTYDGEECAVVMNAWFLQDPKQWPPSPAITPIFFGFHMTKEAAAAFEPHKAYFNKFEPIGCRDLGTAEILREWGVDAYVSGCATMTFSRRKALPANPKTLLVDVSRRLFDRAERAGFVDECHIMPPHFLKLSQSAKTATAEALLALYREEAGQVITSRIHCAMPCFAMGIPTIYCGVSEYRTAVIDDIGIPNHKFSRFRRAKVANLPFKKPDYDSKKVEIANDLRSRLEAHGVQLADWEP